MTVDTIRDLSNRLERHQTAFYKKGGSAPFSRPGMLFYLGYGRELTLSDGRPYETYLKGRESTLQIAFIGPHLRAPDVKTELGFVQFIAQGDRLVLRGYTSGLDTHLYSHDFPGVTELVKPFGAWAADGLARQLKREKAEVRITREVRGEFQELENSVLRAEKIDELTLVNQSTAKLTKIIRAARQIKKPYTVVPSIEDAAFLKEFISNSDNTTAAYVPVVGESAVGLRVIHAQGPLLS